jgi:hypothetical protein
MNAAGPGSPHFFARDPGDRLRAIHAGQDDVIVDFSVH